MEKVRRFRMKQNIYIVLTISIVFVLTFSQTTLLAKNENVNHFKMLSSLEYSGKSQLRNEVEMQCMVKQVTTDDEVKYSLSTESGLGGNKMSFIIDDKNLNLSSPTKNIEFLEKVTNQCAKTLKKVTNQNIGKTWKQSFNISPLGESVPRQFNFTLTAIGVKTDSLGKLIAIRALSEPFFVKANKKDKNIVSIQSRINSIYVFDSELKDIYFSISVFKATTNTNGYNETLQHSVSTCKTDTTGKKIDLSELENSENFKNLISKLGITRNLKVVNKTSSLPNWVRVEGLRNAQVANICAATSCEGTLNPSKICLPAAHAVELQSFSEPKTTSAQLAESDDDNIFNWFGWNWPTAIWGAGITFGTLGAAGAFDDTDTKYRSPAN